jgi:hypothetical protein
MSEARTVIAVRVIPWDGRWGVHVKFSDRTHTAYPVGDRDQAEDEIKRLRPPVPVE